MHFITFAHSVEESCFPVRFWFKTNPKIRNERQKPYSSQMTFSCKYFSTFKQLVYQPVQGKVLFYQIRYTQVVSWLFSIRGISKVNQPGKVNPSPRAHCPDCSVVPSPELNGMSTRTVRLLGSNSTALCSILQN